MQRVAGLKSVQRSSGARVGVLTLPSTVLWGLGLFLTLAAAAPQAKASCGYAVVSTNPGPELIASQLQMVSHPRLPGNCPCDGPQCQRREGPAAIPPATVSLAADDSLVTSQASAVQAHQPIGSLPCPNVRSDSEAHLLLPDPPPRS
jgi:hypothetical protein